MARREQTDETRYATEARQLEALNAGLAAAREELAALASDLEALAARDEGPASANADPDGHPANGDARRGTWLDLRHGLDEIQRHPIAGSAAAFGVGFLLARLVYRRVAEDRGS